MILEQDKANLSRGVITPYGHIRHFVVEDAGFKSKLQNGIVNHMYTNMHIITYMCEMWYLAFGTIFVQPREGMEVLCRNVGSIFKTNQGTEGTQDEKKYTYNVRH